MNVKNKAKKFNNSKKQTSKKKKSILNQYQRGERKKTKQKIQLKTTPKKDKQKNYSILNQYRLGECEKQSKKKKYNLQKLPKNKQTNKQTSKRQNKGKMKKNKQTNTLVFWILNVVYRGWRSSIWRIWYEIRGVMSKVLNCGFEVSKFEL